MADLAPALLLPCLALALCCAWRPAAAQGPLDSQLHEQVVRIAPAGTGVVLQTTLFRPDGPGPFPLLVINHGKQSGNPQAQPRDRFYYMAAAFVRRGYAVMVPMRSGFAGSGGRYVEYGCDMTANGDAQARDVLAAIAYARSVPWIDSGHMVVAGQSYGGLATMALSGSAVPGLRGLLNFAGGLRVDGGNCDWQAALVTAFARYGARGGAATPVPSLWFYGANDSYFGPALASRMLRAYNQGGDGDGGAPKPGAAAALLAYGPFKRDAHGMLASRDGEKIWQAPVDAFLRRIGMPSRLQYQVAEAPAPAPSNYAALANADAIPFLRDNGRAAYRSFLARQTPRAFAVSASGAWGWAEEGEQPEQRALAACQSKSSAPCRLYSVDDAVVWPAPAMAAMAGIAGGGPTSAQTGIPVAAGANE